MELLLVPECGGEGGDPLRASRSLVPQLGGIQKVTEVRKNTFLSQKGQFMAYQSLERNDVFLRAGGSVQKNCLRQA